MKRTRRFIGLLLLAIGVVVLGVSQLLSREERSDTTDLVTGAVSAVAGAANRIAADNRIFTLEVATRMGRGRVDDRDEQMAVLATIAVRSGYGLSEMCASLARVRDAVNAVAADHIGRRLRAGDRIVPDDLADDGHAVMATLNRAVQRDIVKGVRLAVRPAREAQESGCDQNP